MSPVQALLMQVGFVSGVWLPLAAGTAPADPCSLPFSGLTVPSVERLAAAACAWQNASLRLTTQTTDPAALKRTCDYDKRRYLANETNANGHLLLAWLEPEFKRVAEPYYPTAEAFWRDHTALLLKPPPPPPTRCFYRVRKYNHYGYYYGEIKVR